jgi:hypothetical protein
MINIQVTRLVRMSIAMFLGVVLYGVTGCAPSQAIPGPRVTVEEAARKVGIEPTFDGITQYITGSIQLGMSRDQVEQSLSALAPYVVDRNAQQYDFGFEGERLPITCDNIWLKLEPLLWFSACYDAEGHLTDFKSMDFEPPVMVDIHPTPLGY